MAPDFMMKVVGEHAPARGLPVKHPLMHRTRTVDYAIIMAGEIDMMLDDAVVHVKAGDVVVQQATNHAWINRGKEPCRIVFVLTGCCCSAWDSAARGLMCKSGQADNQAICDWVAGIYRRADYSELHCCARHPGAFKGTGESAIRLVGANAKLVDQIQRNVL
jgi:hypothetical protein